MRRGRSATAEAFEKREAPGYVESSADSCLEAFACDFEFENGRVGSAVRFEA